MKAILTKKALERLELDQRIIKEYDKVNANGSHKTAVCELVAANLGTTYSKVYRAINKSTKP